MGAVESNRPLAEGDSVEVFVWRKNPSCGKMMVALERSPAPRFQLGDQLPDPTVVYNGQVYSVDNSSAYVDIGGEVAGLLPRFSAPSNLAQGHDIFVHITGFDAKGGRYVLS